MCSIENVYNFVREEEVRGDSQKSVRNILKQKSRTAFLMENVFVMIAQKNIVENYV